MLFLPFLGGESVVRACGIAWYPGIERFYRILKQSNRNVVIQSVMHNKDKSSWIIYPTFCAGTISSKEGDLRSIFEIDGRNELTQRLRVVSCVSLDMMARSRVSAV